VKDVHLQELFLKWKIDIWYYPSPLMHTWVGTGEKGFGGSIKRNGFNPLTAIQLFITSHLCCGVEQLHDISSTQNVTRIQVTRI